MFFLILSPLNGLCSYPAICSLCIIPRFVHSIGLAKASSQRASIGFGKEGGLCALRLQWSCARIYMLKHMLTGLGVDRMRRPQSSWHYAKNGLSLGA